MKFFSKVKTCWDWIYFIMFANLHCAYQINHLALPELSRHNASSQSACETFSSICCCAHFAQSRRSRAPTVAHSCRIHSIIMYKERVREGRQNGEQTKARYYSVLSWQFCGRDYCGCAHTRAGVSEGVISAQHFARWLRNFGRRVAALCSSDTCD